MVKKGRKKLKKPELFSFFLLLKRKEKEVQLKKQGSRLAKKQKESQKKLNIKECH